MSKPEVGGKTEGKTLILLMSKTEVGGKTEGENLIFVDVKTGNWRGNLNFVDVNTNLKFTTSVIHLVFVDVKMKPLPTSSLQLPLFLRFLLM